MDIGSLHRWFLQSKRLLPWRLLPSSYRVWVSEVMLQQTRASCVVPYFERWMNQFPNMETLASASLEQVIKAWEGLGYYRRARFLHQAAKEIVLKWNGILPDTREALAQIPGLGDYTVNAILSFAFHQKTAAVDGNVLRFFSRHFMIEEEIQTAKARTLVQQLADQHLDGKEPWITAESYIELGSSVCKPQPLCESCPLQYTCLARKAGRTREFPKKNNSIAITALHRSVAVLSAEKHLLLRQNQDGKVMSGLWEFPYVEGTQSIQEYLLQHYQLETKPLFFLPRVVHTFTRYRAHLYPVCLETAKKRELAPFVWVPCEEIKQLPFSSGHRKIWKMVQDQEV